MGSEFQFYKMEGCLEKVGGDGYATHRRSLIPLNYTIENG